jgi:ATP-dependent Clp protease protease subunit
MLGARATSTTTQRVTLRGHIAKNALATRAVTPARANRGAVNVTKSMNFGHEDFFDVVGTERDLILEERFPDVKGAGRGLTKNQIEALGLAGSEARERFSVRALDLGARAAYAKEMPSDNNEPTRYRTVMSGATMTHGGMAPAGAVAPPDLPSLLLNARICYIGMSLVPAVTELVVAELLYLGYEQAEKPCYVYINSGGSLNEKGEVVGMDNEAYAILDTMRYIRPKIHTVAVGKCHGNASLILAAGDKGCRHALPHVQISTQPPKLNRTFDSTQNVQIRANECALYEDTYMGFMSEFSGKDIDVVRKDLDRTRYFTPNQAIEYGLIDKVITKGLNVMEAQDYERLLAQQQAQYEAAGVPMPGQEQQQNDRSSHADKGTVRK